MESLVSPSKPGCSKWHLFLQQCWVSGISHGLDMAAELHAQLDDWALQHLAKGAAREGITRRGRALYQTTDLSL